MQARFRALNRAAAIVPLSLMATVAHATVIISSQPTQNMTCTNGTCAPTAIDAVLNTGDLENDLAAGNVTVTTTGTGVEAGNIRVKSGLSWAVANTLSLIAHRSITVDEPVSVAGLGGMTIRTGGRNGVLSFGKKGNVSFANLSSQLTINGNAYTLVGDLSSLAADVAANPAGFFALAGSYDATGDETASIPTVFNGTFEGLGNTISNLVVFRSVDIGGEYFAGLFAEVGASGTLANVDLLNAKADGGGGPFSVGLLAGGNLGTVQNCNASGAVFVAKSQGQNSEPPSGGLVGSNWGTIVNSYATANMTTENGAKDTTGGLVGFNSGTVAHSYATGTISGLGSFGGLVSVNTGTINSSYATGSVSGRGLAGDGIGGLVSVNSGMISSSYATGPVSTNSGGLLNVGGLVGLNQDAIMNSYASGSVSGGANSSVGGLIGQNSGTAGYSYSTGVVSGLGTYVGGLIGIDGMPAGNITDSCWDTDTSGITNLSQGAGSPANDPGITGLTSAQFQSGLPPGFDPKIWAENPNINGGLPYLLANPPPK